jgi:hypothetical protein
LTSSCHPASGQSRSKHAKYRHLKATQKATASIKGSITENSALTTDMIATEADSVVHASYTTDTSTATVSSDKSTAKALNSSKTVARATPFHVVLVTDAAPGVCVDTVDGQKKSGKRKGKPQGLGNDQDTVTDVGKNCSKLEGQGQKIKSSKQTTSIKQIHDKAVDATHEQPSGDARVAPQTDKSWANVCSSEPVMCKESPPLIHKDIIVKTALFTRTVPTAAVFPRMPPSPSSDLSITMKPGDAVDSFAPVSASAIESASSELTSSPPSTPMSPPVPYARVVRSSSTKLGTPTSIDANVPAQPTLEADPSPVSSSVIEQPLDDLFVMIRQQRQALFAGPLITLYFKDIAITGVHKRVAMAASRVLNQHFTTDPESLEYHSHIDGLDPDAVRYLLISWVREGSEEFQVHTVPIQDTFTKNVALLRAARLLGMEKYTKQILTTFINYLQNELPSYEEIAIVERDATSRKDPLWTHMVNHLCHDRFRNQMPDPEAFATFLDDHPRMKTAMHDTDLYFANQGKKRWEQRQSQNERVPREKRAFGSLRQEMDTKGGSDSMVAPAEEVKLSRNG